MEKSMHFIVQHAITSINKLELSDCHTDSVVS